MLMCVDDHATTCNDQYLLNICKQKPLFSMAGGRPDLHLFAITSVAIKIAVDLKHSTANTYTYNRVWEKIPTSKCSAVPPNYVNGHFPVLISLPPSKHNRWVLGAYSNHTQVFQYGTGHPVCVCVSGYWTLNVQQMTGRKSVLTIRANWSTNRSSMWIAFV